MARLKKQTHPPADKSISWKLYCWSSNNSCRWIHCSTSWWNSFRKQHIWTLWKVCIQIWPGRFAVAFFQQRDSGITILLIVMFGILLGKRLGALKNPSPSIAEKLMLATDNLFEVSHDAMYGLPWWKCFPTKSYKKLVECEDTIYEYVNSFFYSLLKQIALTLHCLS